MPDIQMNFERYEKKYILSEKEYEMFRSLIYDKVKPDEFGESEIRDIYYDTPSHLLIRRSIEKPYYKEKIRLRVYGETNNDPLSFLELKKKVGGIVYKRRAVLPLSEAEARMNKNLPFKSRSQVTDEIDWAINLYRGLIPSMLIIHERKAYLGKKDEGLRITFDCNMLFREEDITMNGGAYGFPILPHGTVLMEIKAPGAFPLWLSEILTNMKIYPRSFSKYGTAYLLSREENRLWEVI